ENANWWKNALPEHLRFDPLNIPIAEKEDMLESVPETPLNELKNHANKESSGEETQSIGITETRKFTADKENIPRSPCSYNTFQPIKDSEVLIPLHKSADEWIT
ncbi:hypothetical protein KI387_043366, partial [Taxus chinensis]